MEGHNQKTDEQKDPFSDRASFRSSITTDEIVAQTWVFV